MAHRPVVIHLGLASADLAQALGRLVAEILKLLERMGAPAAAQPQPEPLDNGPEDAFRLEAIVGDGVTPVPPEPRLVEAATSRLDTVWALPLLPDEPANAPSATLPPDLRRQNTAFWHGEAIETLALTVLARAGMTSLDRRVFISYRRIDSEPMAGQLFDALGRRNYGVYLDTVSTQPGLDFQNQLFEHLADKSMVVVLQSARFQQSRWTMAEVAFALRHDLSLLILRFPDAKEALPGIRAGDQFLLRAEELEPAAGPPLALTLAALQKVVERIHLVHDRELVAHRALMRQRTLEALQRHGLNPLPHTADACLHLADGQGRPRYSLVPAERPPGFAELHGASTRSSDLHGDQRVVVGHTSSLPSSRRRQLDWAIQGRTVRYWDVSVLDQLCQTIREEMGP
ncbi:MAG: toll/interleukin-1 receptor domain-containing protein [Cyanobium sp.]